MTGDERTLTWDGCVNVRDLGGLPLRRGGTTRHGVVVRADDIGALTAAGHEALAGHGVRTVLDLRYPEERGATTNGSIAVVNIPVFGDDERASHETIDGLLRDCRTEHDAILAVYAHALDVHRVRLAEAIERVAEATRDGGVVVHCAVGKDRTGIVSALLLSLAGTALDAIADDYALSHDRVAGIVRRWIEDATDDETRARRRLVAGAPATAMARLLETLERAHGGARAYLVEAGADPGLLDEMAEALRDSP